jgi:hypothetical protein
LCPSKFGSSLAWHAFSFSFFYGAGKLGTLPAEKSLATAKGREDFFSNSPKR